MSAIAQPMPRAELANFLPHKGPMLLLDQVDSWDEAGIVCSASTHNDISNPLRVNGRLSTVHAMEYGAQAAAIHLFITADSTLGSMLESVSGAATSPETTAGIDAAAAQKVVYLGVVRDFDFPEQYLDEKPHSVLRIHSELISASPRIFQYRVNASIDEICYAQGTISLIVGN